jgi:hypothetical protein
MALSIEECVFIVEYIFQDIVQGQFAEKFPETPVPHHNSVRKLNGKFCETVIQGLALGLH